MEKIEASYIAALLTVEINKVYLKYGKIIPESFLRTLRRKVIETTLKTLLEHDLIQNNKPGNYQSYLTSETFGTIFEE